VPEREVPEGLIPHRGPARLVRAILDRPQPDVVVCSGRVPADSAFVSDGRVPAVVLLEMAAQAAAVLQALAAPSQSAARPGYLVAIRAATFRAEDVAADGVLVATVRRTGQAGPLATFDATVSCGPDEILSATLSTHAGG
jgi:predicted hotdog family 3-hydroxylacyl-ACP dehydratase